MSENRIDTSARAAADPRPSVVDQAGGTRVAGGRCTSCGHPMLVAPPRCPVCGQGPFEREEFGPDGTVFSSTILHIPVPGREPPYGLAYIDLDDGPRLLAHLDDTVTTALPPGTRVRLTGMTPHGDPLAAPMVGTTTRIDAEEATDG